MLNVIYEAFTRRPAIIRYDIHICLGYTEIHHEWKLWIIVSFEGPY